MVPDLAPMLAERSLPPGNLQAWSAEPKLDGWRVTVGVSAGWVGVRTRRGRDVTGAIPGIGALAAGGHRLLLDGELVAGAGRASDFYDLMARVASRPRRVVAPVSFCAFDLLWLDGELLIDWPYAERRAALEALVLAGPCGVIPRFPGPDARDLLAACASHDVEGVVLKRLSSRYRPGERSRDWRKVKVPGWAAEHAQQRGPR